MPLHTIVPSTPRLDKLVAAVVLGECSPFPVNEEGTILFQYRQATGLEELKLEIGNMVCLGISFLSSC
jgi:hypothetical protein